MKTNNISLIVDNRMCTGCLACQNICPKKAISQIEKDNTFIYPEINQDKCINCGMCLLTCPAKSSQNYETKSYKVFSGISHSSETQNSSSGGIFYEIASQVISNNGIVYGASLNNLKVSHLRVDKITKLYLLQGSKYVQSYLGNTYLEIEKDLRNNKIVLFSGTPCQCNSISLFLRIRNVNCNNLLLISIACHGVPSQKSFDAYVNFLEKQYGFKILDYSFRRKKDNGIRITLSNGDTKILDSTKDPFYLLFSSGKSLRDSCFNCISKRNMLCDLLIGDFWGIKEIDDCSENGQSLILSFTEKGEKYLEIIKNNDLVSVKSQINANPSNKNPQLFKSINHINNRHQLSWYNEYFDKFEISKSQRKESIIKRIFGHILSKRKNAICIVTIPDQMNYGNRLQNLALQQILSSRFKLRVFTLWKYNYGPFTKRIRNFVKDALFLLRDSIFIGEIYTKKRKANYFNNKYIKRKRIYSLLGRKLLKTKARYFIVGSDQTWNTNNNITNYSFLEFVEPQQRLSYASSIGSSIESINIPLLLNKTIEFCNISLREYDAYKLYKNVSRPNISVNIDPVFLLTEDEWVTKLKIKNIGSQFLFVYYIGQKDETFEEIVDVVAKRNGLQVVYMLHSQINWRKTKHFTSNANTFLEYLYNSSIVLTNSFHGFAFSLIFHKKAIIYRSKTSLNEDSRFKNLKALLGIEISYTSDNLYIENDYDWNVVDEQIKKQQDISLSLLEHLIK